MNVGTDHDTAAFAVESIRRWWHGAGKASYPRARRLLITADAGGSNGYRTRAWKAELAAFAAEAGLEVTVCHFPPGTSKWNKIEHRLFSAIALNWRGRPLTSHQVIVQSIAATTTRTGLTVRAALDTGTYPTGIKISDAQLSALPLDHHGWHGDWNYTLHPSALAARPPAPPPAACPRSSLAWLCHPALTGLTTRQWDALTTALASPSDQFREARLARHRNYRPRQIAPGSGRRPKLTLPSRLAATLIHHRHGLPQKTLADLLQVRPETLNRHIGDIRHLLHQAGHTITPSPHQLTTLDDLCHYAAACGVTIPAKIKTAG